MKEKRTTKRRAIASVQTILSLPAASPNLREGHTNASTQPRRADPQPSLDDSGEGGHTRGVSHSAPATPDPIAQLREAQAQRVATLRMQIRITNQARALVRRHLGFQGDLAEADRAKINAAAAKVVKAIEAGEEPGEAAEVVPYVLASREARAVFDTHRKRLEKRMVALAESLRVYETFVESIRGMGALGLAIIVGECGDLSGYANPGKLWKRLGLAPDSAYAMETKNGREAFAKPKRRRSAMFTVGDSLLKGNDGIYRQAYADRKAYEHARDPGMSKMHAHRRAQRYMEKRLLKHLWQAWRAASLSKAA